MDLKSRILYEDNHLLVVNKLAGELVQGDQTGDLPLLELVRLYIKEEYQKPGNVFCGLVHRIDRPVSGAVVFAKTSKALARMNQQIKDRKMTKIYWAVVENEPHDPERKLIHYLKKNQKLNKSFVSTSPKEGYLQSELIYKLVGKSERFFLLEVELITGRHHQIRAQLSFEGFPIRGDLKYGAQRANRDGSISLHAAGLSFEHPTSKAMIHIEAPILLDELKKIWYNR